MSTTSAGFGAVLRRQARLYGAKPAWVDCGREVSFQAFEQRVDALVDGLRRHGLHAGDRLAIISCNCVSVVECIATCAAGMIAVPLNWRLSSPELIQLLHDCRPSALVCDEHWSKVVDAEMRMHLRIPVHIVLGEARRGWLSYEDVLAEGDASAPHYEAIADDTALLIYTSGTTGTPKAAMISHRSLLANGVAAAEQAIGVSDHDTILCVMPMFHVGGLCYYLLPSFMAGATSVIRPYFDVDDLVRTLAHQDITNVHLVPTMLADFIAHPQAAQSALRLLRIVYAGSAMPVALLQRAMSLLTTCKFCQSYGSTEGGIISSLGPAEHIAAATDPTKEHLLGSCGRPLSGGEVRIVDDHDQECTMGQLGEVLVRSERTMRGYWNKPEQSGSKLMDTYVRTGDIGYRDAQGYLYLVDRKGDMIVTGGENVFPSEVEQVLYRCPEIAEASVFGVPDPRWIEKVVATVVLKPGSTLSAEDIVRHVKQHIAAYKCPKTVHIVAELPRTGVGKISRKHLRTIYGPPAKSADS